MRDARAGDVTGAVGSYWLAARGIPGLHPGEGPWRGQRAGATAPSAQG